MKRFISILFLAISTFLSAQDTTVPIALPITFSKVVEVVYEDFAGTNGRSLSGTFAQAIIQGGTFNPTYEGAKDRLTNFRGYEVSALPSEIILTTTNSANFFMQTITVVTTPTTLTFDVTGDITPFSTDIDYNIASQTLDLTGNTGTATITISNVTQIRTFQITSQNITSLDVTGGSSIDRLNPFSNDLTTLDISNNPLIFELLVRFNNLTDLDISNNPLIINLDAHGNSLTATALDNIYIELDGFGLSTGDLWVDSGRTIASDTARANLIIKGWTITD